MRARFAEDHRKVSATEAESLLDRAGYCDFGSIAGNAEFVAVNPKASGTVVDFKRCHAHHIEGIHHPARYRNFVVVKLRRITVYRFDASACWTGSEENCRSEQTGDAHQAGKFGHGTSRVLAY
jgi:hypothetical protein